MGLIEPQSQSEFSQERKKPVAFKKKGYSTPSY
jgi:hypothetical protein